VVKVSQRQFPGLAQAFEGEETLRRPDAAAGQAGAQALDGNQRISPSPPDDWESRALVYHPSGR